MDDIDFHQRHRLAHRGARQNPTSRFSPVETVSVDDGWSQSAPEDQPVWPTIVEEDHARSVLSRNDSPDVPFSQSVNAYRGCEHGCIYCFARPTHAWLGLSPGVDFESRLLWKPDAVPLLQKALAAPGYHCEPLAMGTNTDPYQPLERDKQVTRSVLALLADCRHPVGLVTKSALITRDSDLLAPMAAQGLVSVGISLTTLDRDLARKLEPRASPPQARLNAMDRLSAQGIPVTAMIAPVIPGLTDHELDALLATARNHGASSAAFILLRLPREVAPLFVDWLEAHVPHQAKRIQSLIRDCRDGNLSDAAFGRRMTGTGVYAELIRQRFHKATRRLGYGKGPALRRDLFTPPPRPEERQPGKKKDTAASRQLDLGL